MTTPEFSEADPAPLMPYAEALKLYSTDRDAYRRKLYTVLAIYWEGGEFPTGAVIRHPLMYVMTPEPPELINERYALKVENVKKAVADGNVSQALLWYEKPWRLIILDELWRARGRKTVQLSGLPGPIPMGPVDMGHWKDALLDYWMLTERPSQQPKGELVSLFKRAGWITDVVEDGIPSPRPDIPLTLYRGVQDKRYAKGLSWTTDPAKAEWFARRFGGQKGYIYETTVQPENLLARCVGRGESEYVVNTIAHEGPYRIVGEV